MINSFSSATNFKEKERAQEGLVTCKRLHNNKYFDFDHGNDQRQYRQYNKTQEPKNTQEPFTLTGTELSYLPVFERAERDELKSRFLIFILLFFFPLFLGEKREKGKIINILVISSHAFLLDPCILNISDESNFYFGY